MCFHIGVVKREIYGGDSDLMPTVPSRFVVTTVFINDGISSFQDLAFECKGVFSLLLHHNRHRLAVKYYHGIPIFFTQLDATSSHPTRSWHFHSLLHHRHRLQFCL